MNAPAQADLFGAPPSTDPAGLRYRTDLIGAAEADALVAELEALPFAAFDFHGFKGLRRVVSFGWRYDFSAARLEAVEPLPGFLESLRTAAAGFAGEETQALAQCLVSEYRPGAPIGWHRDRPQFGKVVGVSFLSPTVLRFRRKAAKGWDRFSLRVEPRSAYLLDGEARDVWEHSIAPVDALRYSVTFRTFRDGPPRR